MYCTTVKELRGYLQTQDLSEVAFDTETTSLDYYTKEIEGLSIHNGNSSIYIDFTTTTEREPILAELRKLFSRSDTTYIAHNIVFDLLMLHKLNIHIKTSNIFCTMIAAFLLNENSPCGLKHIIASVTDKEPVTYEEVEKLKRDDPRFVQYAIDDAENCYLLYKMFKPMLTQQGLDQLFYQIEMPFQFVAVDLKVNGMEADLKSLPKIKQLCEDTLLDYEIKLHELAGVDYRVQKDLLGEKYVSSSLSFSSTPDMVMLIEQKLGLKITVYSSGGKSGKKQKSVGKESLSKLKGKHGFIDLFIKYKKLSKLYNTFVKPFETHVDPDGRIRCNFNTSIVKTGRLSSSNPNLQQLPRDSSEFGFNFRDLFIAPEGKKLIVADFGGQELRILADLSKDPVLLKAFRENIDVHLLLANQMLELGIDEALLHEDHPDFESVKKEHKLSRYKAKNGVNFPIIYGTTAYGIAKNLGVTEKTAQHFIDSFMELFKGAARAMRDCNRFLFRNRYVYTKTGRRRRLTHITDKAKRQAFNFLVQGTAADMVKAAMVLIRRIILEHPEWGMKLVLTVHDEVVVEVNDEYVEVGKQAIEWAMCSAYKLSIPLVVEIGVGNNYGEAK